MKVESISITKLNRKLHLKINDILILMFNGYAVNINIPLKRQLEWYKGKWTI